MRCGTGEGSAPSNVLDDFNRDAQGIEIDTSLPTARVVRALDQLVAIRGKRPGPKLRVRHHYVHLETRQAVMTLNALARMLLPRSLYRRLASSNVGTRMARGAFWALVSSVVVKTASLVQAIALARVLGIAGFGEWGILLSTVVTIGVVASFGAGLVATKYVAELKLSNTHRLGRILGVLVSLSSVLGLICLAVLALFLQPLATLILAAPQLAGSLMLVGVVVCFNALSNVFEGVLSGFERFGDIAVINTGAALVGTPMTVTLAISYGVTGALSGLIVTSLLTLMAFLGRSLILLRKFNIHISASATSMDWQAVWTISLPTTLAALSIVPLYSVAYAALAHQTGGFNELGGFNAANQWRTIVIFLPTQLLAPFVPAMAGLSTTRSMERSYLKSRVLILVTVVSLAVAVPFLLASPWLMRLYGQGFEGYSLVMALLVFKGVFESMNLVLHASMVAVGRAWYLLVSNGIFCAITLAGIMWLIPVLRAVGLAATLLFAQAVHFFVQQALCNVVLRRADLRGVPTEDD
jgi:O-antigen/teichoic acid export membrane protein